MIQICRAEDGQVFKVNASLRDIERIGSLELFVHQEAGVDPDAVLAYLSDGRRLTNTNIRELAGTHEQAIFVFNKHYLDEDLDDVLRELRVEPPLQPPIEENIAATPPFRPSQLAVSYLNTAHTHTEHVNNLLVSLHHQHDSICIASSSLDLHVLNIVDVFEGVAVGARKELEKQATLLAGVEADLEIICRVRIHVDFLSPAARQAIQGGDKPRTLGDYVSNAKMRQVADTCSRTHDELRSKFIQTEQAVAQLAEGATAVRTLVLSAELLEGAEDTSRRAQSLLKEISDVVSKLESPVNNPDAIIQDLKQLDIGLRNEVRFMADTKNAYTEHCMGVLQRISILNNDLIQLPPALTSLQASFRGKTSFSHIQRLHHMLYAYGATVIEIVRRKEFSRFFNQRAQSILEVMAKLSASERKRRQVYRGEVHGQLPFEAKGLDDPVPTLDFTTALGSDVAYSLEREDVDGLLGVLDELEQISRTSNDAIASGAIRESRGALEKLIVKMDSLESAFDRIAERSLLSASRLSSSRHRFSAADERAFLELQDQLQAAQDSKAQQERQYQEDRAALQIQISRLQGDLAEAQDTAAEERARADHLERELHQVRAQGEGESTARRVIDERHSELLAHVQDQHKELSKALSEATEQAKEAELARQELARIRAEFEDVKALETRNSDKVASLLEEQANNLLRLEEARARGEDLEAQIQAARSESNEVHRALTEAAREKDRLLRAQASEHDRIIRDHIAEADGDRAVLEQRFHELKAILEDTERQLKDAQASVDVGNADAIGLREELQRVEHELREARHIERLLREDLSAGRASQSGFEQRLESSEQLIAQILDVALAFRVSHIKAMAMAQAVTAHPNSTSKPSMNLADSVFGPSMRHSIIGQPDEPSPIDPSDPHAALDVLRAFDHDRFLEAIGKTGSTIRKWQKQCKEYRERAKGKISFRNFAKGDLALFLPTRNSVSKPWAAFNVSFPHYFLQASGHLAEQLKTREWIVARITSITECLVDRNDPSSNPFGLGDGIKYYMLEVEDWTQPSSQNKRKSSSKRPSGDRDKEPTEALPLTAGTSPPDIVPGPPQAEVEDTFRVTRPPTSHLFPSRARSNSSPSAGPSSLSRLLAQADAQSSRLEAIPPSRSQTPSPIDKAVNASSPRALPQLPSPPSQATGSASSNVPAIPSPLRPGSRASRLSSASRFSVGRVPPLVMGSSSASPAVAAKAAATTALSEPPIASSPSPGEGNPFGRPSTPSPDGSASEGMSNFINRRRTTSYHVPAPSVASHSAGSGVSVRPSLTATGTLASLASNWGVSFGRRKATEFNGSHVKNGSERVTPNQPSGGDSTAESATNALKRL
ncbi:putative peripheral membrane protein [Pleurotus eryngii]|uniref:Autophagy-related protein 11 n=1 Tax=Pleurotus eryngii TaxID=5323 RepID=A0A9P6A6Y2_PLEER|nr:putative peripheral membrane protein [Pleurotus eryngii]